MPDGPMAGYAAIADMENCITFNEAGEFRV
jgi:hypothetical protein